MNRKATNAEVKAETSQESGSSMVRKHVRRSEDYTVLEPQPPAALQQPSPVAPGPLDVPEEPDEALDYEDELERFLNELDQERGYVIRVDKLTEFKRTGNWNPGRAVVPREFQGEIPFSVHSYLSDVQSLYGPGDYLLTLKDPNRQILRKWPERIGGPMQPAAIPASSIAPVAVSAKPIEVEDSLESFLKMAERMNKLRKVMGWEPPEPPQTQPITATPAGPLSIEEKILERLFGLAETNPAVSERLMAKYLEPPEKDSGWGGILTELLYPVVEAAAPLIPALIATYIRSVQGDLPVAGDPRRGGQAAIAGARPPFHIFMPVAGKDTCGQCGLNPLHPIHGGGRVADTRENPPSDTHDFVGVIEQPCQVCQKEWDDPIHEFEDAPEAPPQMELIDVLVKMLRFCIEQKRVVPELIEQAYQDLQSFLARNPDFAAFVNFLVNGSQEGVIGMLLAGYPELVPALQGSQLALDAIAALQQRLSAGDHNAQRT